MKRIGRLSFVKGLKVACNIRGRDGKGGAEEKGERRKNSRVLSDVRLKYHIGRIEGVIYSDGFTFGCSLPCYTVLNEDK